MADSYTISGDVLTAHLEDEAVLLHMESKSYYRLNGPAACVWKALEAGSDADGVVDRLCREFEVDRKTAGAELERLLTELARENLVSAAVEPNGWPA